MVLFIGLIEIVLYQFLLSSLTPSEWKTIRQQQTDEAQLDMFFRLWTLKEAYVKAIGMLRDFAL
jgi:phosphopantetheinyl transferase